MCVVAAAVAPTEVAVLEGVLVVVAIVVVVVMVVMVFSVNLLCLHVSPLLLFTIIA